MSLKGIFIIFGGGLVNFPLVFGENTETTERRWLANCLVTWSKSNN